MHASHQFALYCLHNVHISLCPIPNPSEISQPSQEIRQTPVYTAQQKIHLFSLLILLIQQQLRTSFPELSKEWSHPIPSQFPHRSPQHPLRCRCPTRTQVQTQALLHPSQYCGLCVVVAVHVVPDTIVDERNVV